MSYLNTSGRFVFVSHSLWGFGLFSSGKCSEAA